MNTTFYEISARVAEHSADDSVVCEICGLLQPSLFPARPHQTVIPWRGWTSDWLTTAGVAQDHAIETGHRVAVESWRGAIYEGQGE